MLERPRNIVMIVCAKNVIHDMWIISCCGNMNEIRYNTVYATCYLGDLSRTYVQSYIDNCPIFAYNGGALGYILLVFWSF